MSPAGQGEGDILKLRAESKLEGCQLAGGNMNCARIRCRPGQYSNGTTSHADPLW